MIWCYVYKYIKKYPINIISLYKIIDFIYFCRDILIFNSCKYILYYLLFTYQIDNPIIQYLIIVIDISIDV